MKQEDKWILLAIFVVVSLPMASAVSDLGTFKQGDCIQLYQLCDNCSYVNLTTITQPNGTVLFIGTNMTKNGVDYNYTLCQTTLVGEYLYNVCGDKDNVFTCENIGFNITPSGTEGNDSYYILVFALVYGIAFVGFFGRSEWVTIFGSLAMMVLGVYILNSGIVIFRDVLTTALASITIGLGAFFALYTTIAMLKENY